MSNSAITVTTGATTSEFHHVTGTRLNGKTALDVNVAAGSIVIAPGSATGVTIFNVAAPTAGVEVSQALPANTKMVLLRVRGVAKLQYAWAATQSGTTYVTVPRGTTRCIEKLAFSSQTLYMQTDANSQTIELEVYT